jgi:transcription elongation factor Elf1
MTFLASKITITCAVCGHLSSEIMVCEDGLDRISVCSKCGNIVASVKFQSFSGYIYILSNPAQIDLYKVGQTTRPVEERVRELNQATGVAAPFNIEATFPSTNPPEDERLIHSALSDHRYTISREFFSASFEKILSACSQQTDRAPSYLNPNVKNDNFYDPWCQYRPKPTLITPPHLPVAQPPQTTAPPSLFAPRNAYISNKSFHCPQCRSKMRPVKDGLNNSPAAVLFGLIV